MSIFKAILLGIIQGITEFFPISSSGHLIIAEQFLGIETDYGVLFNIILHIGTLGAIVLAFRKEVMRILYSYLGIIHDIWKNIHIFFEHLLGNREHNYKKILRTQYRKLSVMIILANVPTAMIGLILKPFVEKVSHSVFVSAIGLLVTGLLLFVSSFSKYGSKVPKHASWLDNIIIGAFQGIAVIPGISRFGTTMIAGKLCGFSKLFGLKYSYLISIPAIFGATVLEIASLPKSEVGNLTFGFVIYSIVGAVIAAAVGLFAIRMLAHIVKNERTRLFSYYCFVIGLAVLSMNFMM